LRLERKRGVRKREYQNGTKVSVLVEIMPNIDEKRKELHEKRPQEGRKKRGEKGKSKIKKKTSLKLLKTGFWTSDSRLGERRRGRRDFPLRRGSLKRGGEK